MSQEILLTSRLIQKRCVGIIAILVVVFLSLSLIWCFLCSKFERKTHMYRITTSPRWFCAVICSIVPHPWKIWFNFLKSEEEKRQNLLNLSSGGGSGEVSHFDTSLFVIVYLRLRAVGKCFMFDYPELVRKRAKNKKSSDYPAKKYLWAVSTAFFKSANWDISIFAASFSAALTMSRSGASTGSGMRG